MRTHKEIQEIEKQYSFLHYPHFTWEGKKRQKTPAAHFFVTNPRPQGTFFKGALKAHIHISFYESNTLQEQDTALLFLSVIQ